MWLPCSLFKEHSWPSMSSKRLQVQIYSGIISPHCNENPIYVIPEKEFRGFSPNFYINVSVSDLYMYFQDRSTYFPAAELADRLWGIYRSQTHECGNWDWGGTIPFLGIFVLNVRYCAFAVQTWLPGPCGPGYDPRGSAFPWLSGGTTVAGCSTCNRGSPSWKVTRWIFLWRSYHFKQYFLCMRCWFSKPFKIFSLPYTIIKGTVLRDRFRKCWQKLTDLGLNKGHGWFLNFSEAPLIFSWNKTSSLR